MQQTLVGVVAGILGGVVGAVGVALLAPPRAGDGGAAPPVRDAALEARVQQLEEAWKRAGLDGPRLEGRADAAPSPALDPEAEEALAGRLESALAERLEPRLATALEERWKEELAKEGEKGSDEPRRRRVPLADVAREVGLSAAEEDDLRRIYEEASQRFLEIMAAPDGDVEQVKRDWESFQNDEKSRTKLMAKYVPKLVTNIGEIMAIEAEKDTRVREAVGDEKANRLGDYEIIEERPFGMGGTMSVEARAER